jgi:uncharacterized protein (TIGR03437 family)
LAAAGAAQGQAALPSLSAAPASLTFSQLTTATQVPPAQSIKLKGSGNAQLDFSISVLPPAPWLIVALPSGTTPATVNIEVNPFTLGVGEHSTNLVISSLTAGNTPISVPVTLWVNNPPPTMSTAPATLTFNYQTDQAGPLLPLSVSVDTDGEPLSFTASAGSTAWLSIAPASGVSLLGSPTSVVVTANPAGVLPGAYSGKVTFSSTTAADKTVVVPVSLVVAPGTAILNTVFPPAVGVGSPDIWVTLTGSYLYPATVVHVGATVVTSKWISTGALLADVPSTMFNAQGTLAITATNAPQPASNAVTLTIAKPGPLIWTLTNGASFASLATPLISPGEIVSIFGSGLGPSQGIVAPTPGPGDSYPTSLGDPSGPTIVLFETDPTTDPATWQAAPILYAQNGQINCVVPFNMNPVPNMAVTVSYNNVTSDPFIVNGAATDIGIFTVNTSGQGQAAVLNYDATSQTYSLNSATNPALAGSTIAIYATGGGQTTPLPATDGAIVALPPTTTPVLAATPTTVTIGTDTVNAQFAGAVPGSIAGLVQINATVPPTVKSNKAVPIWVTIVNDTSPAGVTIAVK